MLLSMNDFLNSLLSNEQAIELHSDGDTIITPGARKIIEEEKKEVQKLIDDDIITPIIQLMFLVGSTINGLPNASIKEKEFSKCVFDFMNKIIDKDYNDQLKLVDENMDLINRVNTCLTNGFRIK